MTRHLPSIPTYVVAGFLGAGKTTFINSVLATATEPMAVVVNDFGSINVDASLISSQTDDVLELTNGCVCCSVGESLADVLYSILDRTQLPTSILIEASGVADPSKISAYTHLAGLHNAGTLVLVDAIHAHVVSHDTRVARTFWRQVDAADLLAITKTDLVSREELDKTHALLYERRKHTPLVKARPDVLSELVVVNQHRTPDDFSHDGFSTLVLPTLHFHNKEALRTILNNLPNNTVRAKGVISFDDGERRLVQLVGKHLALTPTTSEITGIVVIYTD